MFKKSRLPLFGWVLSVALGLFLAFVSVMEIIDTTQIQAGFDAMNFGGPVRALGLVLLLSVILYLWKRTGALGAILLTGYLGGAVCAHFVMGQSGLAVVPFLFGVAVWAGLWLREERVREILPLLK